MLLVSETHFFEQPQSHRQDQERAVQETRTQGGLKDFLTRPLMTVGTGLHVPA
jgi:hypothetical protein